MDEKTLIEHYKKKLSELNELLDSGMLSFSEYNELVKDFKDCLLYTSPSPRDKRQSRMPSSA